LLVSVSSARRCGLLLLTTLQAPAKDSNDRQQSDYANGQPPNALASGRLAVVTPD
jgi:hypothetical protein